MCVRERERERKKERERERKRERPNVRMEDADHVQNEERHVRV